MTASGSGATGAPGAGAGRRTVERPFFEVDPWLNLSRPGTRPHARLAEVTERIARRSYDGRAR